LGLGEEVIRKVLLEYREENWFHTMRVDNAFECLNLPKGAT